MRRSARLEHLVGPIGSLTLAACPGTIRGDFGLSFSNNLVHGSDGPESSATELALFFSDEGDLIDWTPDVTAWVYSQEELS